MLSRIAFMNQIVRPGSVLFALLILGCSNGFAEPPIAGTVRGAKNETLEGVSVTLALRSSTRLTLTDSKGAYRFEGLGTGTYGITFEKEGYMPVTRDITLTFDDDSGKMDVKMRPVAKTKKAK
jgi:hypothetical protein